MLTITYNGKKLYINIRFLKRLLIIATFYILKAFTLLFSIAGIALLLGTAGAFDNNIISFGQVLIQTFYGFMCFGIAYITNSIKRFAVKRIIY